MSPRCFGIGAVSALWLSGRNCPYFESCRRSGCFGQSRYLVSGVLIRSSFEIPWGARKKQKNSQTFYSASLHPQTAFPPRWPKLCRSSSLRLRLIELLRPRAVSASKRLPGRASSRDGSPRPGSRFVWHSCCSAHFGGCARGERAIRFPRCKTSPSICPSRPPWDQAQPSPSNPSTTTTRLILARRAAVQGPARVGAPTSEFSSTSPRRKTTYD